MRKQHVQQLNELQVKQKEARESAISSVPLLLEYLESVYPNSIPTKMVTIEELRVAQGQLEVLRVIRSILNPPTKDN